MLDYKYMW